MSTATLGPLLLSGLCALEDVSMASNACGWPAFPRPRGVPARPDRAKSQDHGAAATRARSRVSCRGMSASAPQAGSPWAGKTLELTVKTYPAKSQLGNHFFDRIDPTVTVDAQGAEVLLP
jgi:hypothetical protein